MVIVVVIVVRSSSLNLGTARAIKYLSQTNKKRSAERQSGNAWKIFRNTYKCSHVLQG